MSVSSANKPGAGPAARQPEFPPLITGHGVGEGVDAFAHAVAGARDGRYGAGDFVWSRSPVAFAAALVLAIVSPLTNVAAWSTILERLDSVFEYDKWTPPRARVFLLEDARCTGQSLGARGPCDRSCALVWHEDWLTLEPNGSA